ncbi:KAP family P-loop NTPase fold protein [Mucilaginibacter flavidus]|uniref:KAP family P-loop NTPase fold protein n=1 Tax=Mucilaginibacter flavidus TaxID=2949309 RepID=UPI00209279C1|nr:P-loop NTPase fold protein [Mucilaginibacter flavidus]MCO5945318.1 KAP family NTPase [Mucilaginibacter flavidus]
MHYKTFKSQLSKNGNASFIEDSDNYIKDNDHYYRTGYANIVATRIEATTTQSSFGIGIFAEWGQGKTDFLKRLYSALNENQEENILVQFNPWRINNGDLIVDDFFKTLANSLKPYHATIADKINSYSKKIFQTSKEASFRFIDTVIDDFIDEPSVTERYDTINTYIKSTGKRIIVFIDDLDRLTAPEILEVLRIIRNTANFSNTFFVVAIDHNYVIETLKKTNLIGKEKEYLKKIFQLVLTLPTFKKEVISNQIKVYIKAKVSSYEDIDSLNTIIDSLSYKSTSISTAVLEGISNENILENLLDNLRDVKRFCNSFLIQFEILRDEVYWTDLFLIELIKAKSYEVYCLIESKKILTADESNYDSFKLLEPELKQSLDNLNFSPREQIWITKSIEALVEKNDYGHIRRFKLVSNFYLYFSYQLFNDKLSMKKFREVIADDNDVIIETFKIWIEEGFYYELDKIMDAYSIPRTLESIEKYGVLFLRLEDETDTRWFNRATSLFWNRFSLLAVDNEKSSIGRKAFHKLIDNKSLTAYSRARFVSAFVRANSKEELKPLSEGSTLFSTEELLKMIYKLFKEFLSVTPNYNFRVQDFLLFNSEQQHESPGNNRRINIALNSTRLLKKFLLNNEFQFGVYLLFMLRKSSGDELSTYFFDPFAGQIFSSTDEFLNKLENYDSDNQYFKMAKDIIIKYFDRYYPAQRQFKVDPADKDEIDMLIDYRVGEFEQKE